MEGISRKKLSDWGLLNQVKKEEIIDSKLKNLALPKNFVMEELVQKWLKNNGIKSNDSLKEWIKNKGLDMEQWNKIILRDYRWRLWCEETFKKDLPSYYLKRKPLLDLITYSLIRVRDKDVALELFLRIKEGEEEFKDLSREFSEGPESQMGGVIGPVNMKQTHPILAKMLLISKEKQLWPPKKIDDWWIIVRLEKLKNTEFSQEISSYLSYELGERFLINEINKSKKNDMHIGNANLNN